MKDIIIIGGGPVGLYSATLASLHNLNGILIEGLKDLGGQLTSLYPEKDIIDLPGISRIRAGDFIKELIDQTMSKPNHLDLHVGEEVNNIEKIDGGYLVTTNKDTYEGKYILITSGMGKFTPRKINLPNEDDFKNIYYSIPEKEIFRNKRVAVLGGGDSAVDVANMLSDIALEVSIVHRRNDFRAKELSVNQLKENGVHIYKPYLIKSLAGKGDIVDTLTISHLEVERDDVIPVDAIIVNYGITTVASSFPVQKNKGGIEVDNYFETSMPNVFAIGNSCHYEGKVKNLTCGFGEAVIAITKIDQLLNPTKNIPIHF